MLCAPGENLYEKKKGIQADDCVIDNRFPLRRYRVPEGYYFSLLPSVAFVL